MVQGSKHPRHHLQRAGLEVEQLGLKLTHKAQWHHRQWLNPLHHNASLITSILKGKVNTQLIQSPYQPTLALGTTAQWIKSLLGIPESYFKSLLPSCFQSSSLPKHPGNSRSWLTCLSPVSYVGDLERVPSSWFLPGQPSCCGHFRVNQQLEALSILLKHILQ